MSDANEFDLQRIRDETYVSEVEFHAELASTNATVLERNSREDCPVPMLVVTKNQTAGRGRGANEWWSNEGALTFTLLIELPLTESSRFNSFTLTTGLAICQAIQKFATDHDIKLKWPNDVYADGKKICGILTERPSNTHTRLVVGIGINVNNSLSEAPEELQEKATSLIDVTGSRFGLTDVLVECLQMLERRQNEHIHEPETIVNQWPQWCLLTGKPVTVEMHGRTIKGTCCGIDAGGALIVDDGQQQIRCVSGVVVSFDRR